MTLITLRIAWLIGIAVHYLSPPLAPSAALRAGLIGLLAILPLAAFILWTDDLKVRGIAACGLFLGSLRCTLSLPDLSDAGHIAQAQQLRPHTDRGWITLWGRSVGESHMRETYANLRVAVDRVKIK
jgi:hypothetical protein